MRDRLRMQTALGIVLLLYGLAAIAGDAEALVSRVAAATKSLSYDGIFVYSRASHLDAMRIVHRAINGVETERLVSLSGPAREVVRDGTRVTCTFADDKAVMVEKRQPSDFLGLDLSEPIERVSRFYTFAIIGHDRVAGRPTTMVLIQPKEPDRYGYRLWLDDSSNLLLKSAVLDRHANTLEQVMFTQIQISDAITDERLRPELDGAGFTWYTNSAEESPAAEARGQPATWSVGWLPRGFEMRNFRTQHLAASKMPVKHLVYSDGLAMISVFVEELLQTEAPLQGYSSMGAVNAFSRVDTRYQITVVGEVPQPTVRQIAMSVINNQP